MPGKLMSQLHWELSMRGNKFGEKERSESPPPMKPKKSKKAMTRS